MKEYKIGENIFYFAPTDGIDDDLFIDDSIIKTFLEDTIDDFIHKDKLIERYVDAYSKKHGLKGFGVLHAHGTEDSEGNWCYNDDEDAEIVPVQDWIDKLDKKYAALLVTTCNPEVSEITSKKSLVFIPNQNYSKVGHRYGSFQIEMYVPGEKGPIDNYVLESDVMKLEAEVKGLSSRHR